MASVTAHPGASRTRHIGSGFLALLAILLAVIGVARTASAQDPVDITFDTAMANPLSYDQAVGGGTWGNTDNEFQWKDYHCDSIVSFLLNVTHETTAGSVGGPRTVEIDLSFAAGSSGQPGAAFSDIVGVTVNTGDPAQAGNGDSTATLLDEQLTDVYTLGGTLTGTVRVNNLDPGDTVIVRIDVRATCLTGAPRAGILYAVSDGAREVSPEARNLGSGQDRNQIVQVNSDGDGGTTTTTTAAPTTTTEAPTTTTTGPTTSTSAEPTTSTTGSTSTTASSPAVEVHKALLGSEDEDGSHSVTTGDTLTYKVTVINVGNVDLNGVVVTDDLPGAGAVDCGSFTGFLPWGGVAGSTVDCTVTYVVTAADMQCRGFISNTATATAQNPPATDTSDPAVVPTSALVGLTNTPDRAAAYVGEFVTFTVVVSNPGGVDLTNVHVTDPDLGIDETIPLLAVAQSQSFSAEHLVTVTDAENGTIENTAFATSNETPQVEALATVDALAQTIVLDAVIYPSARLQDPGSSTGSLPYTGGRVDGPLWMAAALATAGAAYVVASRRPRAARLHS